MGKFTHKPSDAWSWRRAIHTDVEAIMDLMATQYQCEVDEIFSISRTRMGYHLHQAILQQSYLPNQELLGVAIKDNQVIAWHWLTRGGYQPYSDLEMATGEFVHVDLDLSARTKIQLCAQILEQWQAWCLVNAIPVLASTSIREEHGAFMQLHRKMGFKVNGSYAIKRINNE